jgi:hypothetical protein
VVPENPLLNFGEKGEKCTLKKKSCRKLKSEKETHTGMRFSYCFEIEILDKGIEISILDPFTVYFILSKIFYIYDMHLCLKEHTFIVIQDYF